MLATKVHVPPPAVKGIARVQHISALGVTLSHNVSMTKHIDTVMAGCARTLYGSVCQPFCCSRTLYKCHNHSRNPMACNGIFRVSGNRCPQRSREAENLWESVAKP